MPGVVEPNYLTIGDPKKRATSKEDWRDETESNQISLRHLVNDVMQETRKNQRLKIAIIGYSDTAKLSGQIYQSNYELAEARAQNVKQMVQEKLSEQTHDV